MLHYFVPMQIYLTFQAGLTKTLCLDEVGGRLYWGWGAQKCSEGEGDLQGHHAMDVSIKTIDNDCFM